MKKLLSAVTSVVMSTSLITSAFASSFNVSAAGRISAEQPNVSLEDVMDVSALLTAASFPAGTPANDFVVESGTVSGKPGDTVTIEVFANPGSYNVAQVVTRLIDEDLPSGFKVVGIGDGVSYALGKAAVTTQGEFNYINALKDGEPTAINTSQPVVQYDVKIPDNAQPGNYNFSLSRFSFAPDRSKVMEAKINAGTITVTGGGQTQTQAPVTQAPATQAPATQGNPGGQSGQGATWDKGPAMDDFVVYSGDWTANPGDTLLIEVFANSNNKAVAQLVSRLNDRDLPSGFKVVGLGDEVSYAAKKAAVDTQGEFQYINTLDKEGAPQTLKDSDPIIQYEVKIPSDASGKYDFSLSRFTVATDRTSVYEAKIMPGTITVGGGSTPTSAPQQNPTSAPQQNPTSAPQQNPTSAPQAATKDQSGAAEWDKGPAMNDFIVYSGDWKANAGDTFTIEVMVDSANKAVAQMVSRLNNRDLPTGFSVVGLGDEVSYAAKKAAVDTQGEFQYINTLDKEGSPQTLNDSQPVVQYDIKVDSSVAAGKYDFSLSRFTVATSRTDCYEAKIIPGTITIGGGGQTPTSGGQTPTSGGQTPTNAQTPAAEWDKGPAMNDFIVYSGDWTVNAGETVTVEVMVDSANKAVAQMVSRLNNRDLPGGMTVVGLGDEVSYAAKKAAVDTQGEFQYISTIDKEGAPQTLKDSEPVVQYDVKVDSSVAPGKYDFSLSRFTVATSRTDCYEAKIVPGTITVKGGDTPTSGGQTPTADPGSTTWEPGPELSDFIVHSGEASGKPGTKVDLDVMVESNGREVAHIVAGLLDSALPQGITVVGYGDEVSYAARKAAVSTQGKYQYINTLYNADPAALNDKMPVITYTLNIPASAAPGTYDFSLSRFTVATDGKTVYEAKILPGKITVEGENTTEAPTSGAVTPTQAAPTQAPTNAPAITGGAKWVIPTETVKEGTKQATLKVYVDGTSDLAVAGAQFMITDDKLIVNKVDGTNAAYTSGVIYNGEKYAFGTGAAGAAKVAAADATIFTITFDIPNDAKAGDVFPVKWDQSFFYASGALGADVSDKVVCVDGAVKITGSDPEQLEDGTAKWVIDSIKVEEGAKSATLDVYNAGNSTLSVAGAQFGISPDARLAFTGTAGTNAAYGSPVVYNTESDRFAFGTGAAGAGKTASDSAVITKLVFNIPADAKAGDVFDVAWGDKDFLYVSGALGKEVTDKVTLVPGKIEIVPHTGDPDESVKWVIQKVYATPGSQVELPVLVDASESNLKVAGAQFIINAEGVEFVSASGSDAYGPKLNYNTTNKEFAFGVGNGSVKEAANDSVVLKLVYNVPTTAKPGDVYPVTWAKGDFTYVSGLLGADITSFVELIDGEITIVDEEPTEAPTEFTTIDPVEPPTAIEPTEASTNGENVPTEAPTQAPVEIPEGMIAWQIPVVYAQPGENVTMTIKVVDTNGTNLNVGGAQFVVTGDERLTYTGSAGTEAYEGKLVYNDNTHQYAFRAPVGGKAAADGSTLMTVSFTVPSDITETTEFPVTFANEAFRYVSEAMGGDITDKVMFIDGKIIVEVEEPTEVQPTEETPTEEQPTAETPTEEQPTAETPTGEQPTAETPTGEQPTAETPTEEQPTAETPTEEQPTAETPTGEQPTAETPTEEQPTVETPTGEQPTAETPTGEQPTAETPTGEQPTAETPTGEQPTGGEQPTEQQPTETPVVIPEGMIAWQIPVVYAQPGENVTMTIKVLDTNGTNLNVGGAQFVVAGDERLTYNASAGTDAYEGKLVYNDNTHQYAFRAPVGGKAAADGTTLMTVTFTVPSDITQTTEFPVTFADEAFRFVSDAKGGDITDKVMFIDGKIIVEVGEQPTEEQPTAETPTEEQPTAETPTEEQPTAETPTEEQPTAETPTEEQPTAETPTEEQPTAETPTGEQPTAETPTGEQPTAETPTGEQPTAETPTEEQPTAETPTGEQPTAETPTEEQPTAETPTGEQPTNGGEEPTQAPTADSSVIGWTFDSVEGAPGEEVTLTLKIDDPKNTGKIVAGGQFVLVPTLNGEPVPYEIVGVDGKPYGKALNYDPTTGKFAFGNEEGVASVDGQTMFTIKYKIPENATPGDEVKIEFRDLEAVAPLGVDITPYIWTTNGTIKVVEKPTEEPTNGGEQPTAPTEEPTNGGEQPTAPTEEPTDGPQTSVYAVGSVVDGFYFNHDTRKFNKGHLDTLKIVTVTDGVKSDETDLDKSLVELKAKGSDAETPNDAYTVDQNDFTYVLTVYYNGAPLTFEDGTPVEVKAYIGVKGDTNFDNQVDSTDATNVLSYYANLSTGGKPENTILAQDAKETMIYAFTGLELDDLAAFLGDVDLDVYSEDNWKMRKADRTIDATDASAILAFYADMMTGVTDRNAGWNHAVSGREEQMRDIIG